MVSPDFLFLAIVYDGDVGVKYQRLMRSVKFDDCAECTKEFLPARLQKRLTAFLLIGAGLDSYLAGNKRRFLPVSLLLSFTSPSSHYDSR